MAHLWVRDGTERLLELALEEDGATLAAVLPLVRPGRLDPGDVSRPFAWLVPALEEHTGAWVLACSPAARVLVNGISVPAGLRVLGNRDEIRCPDGRLVVFSDERFAHIEPLPVSNWPLCCGRCTCEIDPASPAVRCPSCGSWYHEHGDFPCWTSVPFCQACGQATGLAGDTRWTPEES
jgi:hypothetical protein